jgi:hypothetical protein
VVFPTGNTETDSMISVTSLNDINNTNLLNALNVSRSRIRNVVSLDI